MDMSSNPLVTRAFFVGFLSLSLFCFASGLTSSSIRSIQVCQNKDCCQRWKGQAVSLPEVLQDYFPTISIESTSCLSQCGKGPNACVNTNDKGDVYLRGLIDPTVAAVQMESLYEDSEGTSMIPSKLVAAATCMEKAVKAQTVDEKERYLSSVIRTLDNSESPLRLSSSNACAHVLRADLHLEHGDAQAALHDAQHAVQILQTGSSMALLARALRLESDAHVALGNIPAAIECLKHAISLCPGFQTKFNAEIKQLQQQLETSKQQ